MKALVASQPAMRRAVQSTTVPTVDAIMLEERAAAFTKRSIKTSAKLAGLKMAVSMCDLTTLEGKDTPGKVAYLCRKALQPAEGRFQVPPCAVKRSATPVYRAPELSVHESAENGASRKLA